jgi:hypothetical protein
MTALAEKISAFDWPAIEARLEDRSYAVTPPLFSASDCAEVAGYYGEDARFRSTVVMARHGFGSGSYRYFSAPLPSLVGELRTTLYPHLARTANRWACELGEQREWPETHAELTAICREAGQTRPTPLLLRYTVGDYNCLHQDLYGAVHFPLQAIVQLNRPDVDFSGGNLVLVENRPRMQSRCETVALPQGSIAIIPVKERPRQGSRGPYKTQLRHGVSSIDSGVRHTLGLIFHDAA